MTRLRSFIAKFPLELILQCDETPAYFDMLNSKTIEFVGAKSVDLITTGHDKTRFTVLLTIAASGLCLNANVVFRRAKKVPVCEIPSNVAVHVNSSETMDTELMLDYLRQIVFGIFV